MDVSNITINLQSYWW